MRLSRNFISSNPATFLFTAIAIVIIGKVWVILEFGGLKLGPDTLFIKTAKEMLARGTLFIDAGLTQEAIPHALWKTLGYSWLIAGFMKIFGDTWYWWLYGLQAGLSLVAGIFLYRLALAMGLGAGLSIVVFLLHQWSTPFSTDGLIATNSLDGSLATIVLADFGLRLLSGRTPGLMVMALYGGLIGACFLMRLTYEYWAILLSPFLIVLLYQTSGCWRKTLRAFAVFALTLFCVIGAYKGWNYSRVGHFTASTGGQTAYMANIIMMAQQVAPEDPGSVITEDSTLDRTLREAFKDRAKSSYQLAKHVNQQLFSKAGLTAIDIHALASRRYLRLAMEHPFDWIELWYRNGLWAYQGTLFTGPIVRYDDLQWWAKVHGRSYYQGWREQVKTFMQTGDPTVLSIEALFQAGVRFGLRIAGVAMLALLFIGTMLTSWQWFRQATSYPLRSALLATFGCLYFLTAFMFAVHFVEVRYLSSVVGVGILAAVAHAQSLANFFLARMSHPATL